MEMEGSTFLDEEWESLSKMFCGGETPHDDGSLFPTTGEIPFLAFPHENSYNLHSHDTNFCSTISHEESSNTSLDRYDHDNASFEPSMVFYNNSGGNLMMPIFSDDAMEEILNSKAGQQHQHHDSCKQIKRKKKSCHEPENSSPQIISPNKIPRLSRNAGKNGKKKKIEEEKNMDEEESKSSCSSEDDSQQVLINGSAGSTNSKSKGKSKASKGSATDPQSLYARRRRERINERLKILQNLVPNGTKVDISTMLEEAVQYVKFLQLQIKLLSSDDMWMYAPLAYNGMDIGMYQKISPNLRLQIN